MFGVEWAGANVRYWKHPRGRSVAGALTDKRSRNRRRSCKKSGADETRQVDWYKQFSAVNWKRSASLADEDD